MKCKNCGTELNPNEKFCVNCGASQKKANFPIYVVIIIIFIVIGIAISSIFVISKFIKNQSFDGDKKTFETNLKDNVKESKTYIAYPKPEKKYLQINEDTSITAAKENDINKNIEIKDVFMVSSNNETDTNGNKFGEYFIIYAKNNNDFPININAYLDLYDKDNYRIKNIYETAYAIKPNKEFIIKIRTELETEIDVEDYKITFDAKKIDDYYNDINVNKSDFDIVISNEKDSIFNWVDGTITNKTSNDFFLLDLLIKFYKNGKIVNIDHRVQSLEPNATKDVTFNTWKLDDEFFKYDNYEVDIVSAYSMETKNW